MFQMPRIVLTTLRSPQRWALPRKPRPQDESAPVRYSVDEASPAGCSGAGGKAPSVARGSLGATCVVTAIAFGFCWTVAGVGSEAGVAGDSGAVCDGGVAWAPVASGIPWSPGGSIGTTGVGTNSWGTLHSPSPVHDRRRVIPRWVHHCWNNHGHAGRGARLVHVFRRRVIPNSSDGVRLSHFHVCRPILL